MDNKGLTVFLVIDSVVLFALIVIKTALFFKAARKKTLKRWFYFNTYDIEDAPTDTIKLLRKKQNTYSLIILFSIIASAIIAFFIMASGE